MTRPFFADLVVCPTFAAHEIIQYRRDSRRSLAAHRAFKRRRDVAEIRGSLNRIFTRSLSNSATSIIAAISLPTLITAAHA